MVIIVCCYHIYEFRVAGGVGEHPARAISFSASLSPCAQQVPNSVRRAYSTECGFTPKCFAVSGYNRFVISWILSPELMTCSIMYTA